MPIDRSATDRAESTPSSSRQPRPSHGRRLAPPLAGHAAAAHALRPPRGEVIVAEAASGRLPHAHTALARLAPRPSRPPRDARRAS
jgi:hypothetical protein